MPIIMKYNKHISCKEQEVFIKIYANKNRASSELVDSTLLYYLGWVERTADDTAGDLNVLLYFHQQKQGESKDNHNAVPYIIGEGAAGVGIAWFLRQTMFHHFKINNKMSFLLNFFSRAPQSTARQQVQRTLQLIKIDSEQALPDNYYELIFLAPNQRFSKAELLGEIVAYLGRAKGEAAIVKIYTIIVCAIRMSDYDESCCQALQQLQASDSSKFEGQKPLRLQEFQKSCNSYLIKLPSISQLYLFSLQNKAGCPYPECHIALYRMMNQFSLLFPHINTTMNTIGRYYKQAYLYYKQFYRVWRSEIVLGYNAMKKIIDDLIINYSKKDVQVLECFIGSVPEIELLCDQMENFITNKYYKGKNPNKKVYFKVEALQEIEYYIIEAGQQKGKIEEDFIRTADQDFFSTK